MKTMYSVNKLVQAKKLGLARQMKDLQRKTDFLRALESMDNLEITLELFDLLDNDSDGYIPFPDLMTWLSSCEQLVDAVAPLDVKGIDSKGLVRERFGHFLTSLASTAGGEVRDWAELLIVQHQLPDVPEYTQQPPAATPAPGAAAEASEAAADMQEAARDMQEAARDGRMRNLFALFDMDLDGKVGFKDVVVGLHKIAPHIKLHEASTAAVQVLLSYDENHDRTLDFKEFVHFITAFLHAGKVQFGAVADALLLAAARPDPVGEEGMELEREVQEHQVCADVRAQKIFALLDEDQDGLVSFKELVLGLHKLEAAKPLTSTARNAARWLEAALLEEGAQGNRTPQDVVMRQLNQAEFADVLSHFVKESGAEFEQVADYLLAVEAAAPADPAGARVPSWLFQRFLEDSSPHGDKTTVLTMEG